MGAGGTIKAVTLMRPSAGGTASVPMIIEEGGSLTPPPDLCHNTTSQNYSKVTKNKFSVRAWCHGWGRAGGPLSSLSPPYWPGLWPCEAGPPPWPARSRSRAWSTPRLSEKAAWAAPSGPSPSWPPHSWGAGAATPPPAMGGASPGTSGARRSPGPRRSCPPWGPSSRRTWSRAGSAPGPSSSWSPSGPRPRRSSSPWRTSSRGTWSRAGSWCPPRASWGPPAPSWGPSPWGPSPWGPWSSSWGPPEERSGRVAASQQLRRRRQQRIQPAPEV